MLKWLKFNPKFFLYTFLILTCLFTVSALAQANLLKDKQNAISQGGNQEAWLSEAFSSNAVAGLQSLTGPIPDSVIDGTATSWIPGGAIGSANNIVAALYNPPASGIDYIAKTWDGFLGKPAYAQNTGFVGLQPILPIWRGFRNVVYILSSLVFIVIGIMIMLRVKISPQAVITVQNAIPQLITTLILVTFSYAIAGLLIDLTTLIQGIALSALFSGKGINPGDPILKQDSVQFVASKLSALFGGNYNVYNLQDLLAHNGLIQTYDLINRLLPFSGIALMGGLIGALIGGVLGSLAAGPGIAAGALVGTLGVSVIVLLVFSIIIFIKLLGFLFALIKVYVNVILKIILAPIEIGLGAFPGSKQGFSSWLFELIANLAVFPGCLLFLVFVNVIMETISGGSMWTPPIMGITGAAIGGRLIAALFGFGAFLILSKLPEMIPQIIFALKPSPWNQAIGQGLSNAAAPAKFMYNTGVDVAAGGIETGAGPFRSIWKEIEGLNPGQGVPKQAGSILRNIFRTK